MALRDSTEAGRDRAGIVELNAHMSGSYLPRCDGVLVRWCVYEVGSIRRYWRGRAM